MYKIHLTTPSGKVIKSKKYESLQSFLKWKEKHEKKYSRVYDVICFRWEDGNWKKYNEKVH